jgi:uncharacterized protein (DUF2062 family)
MATIQHRWLWIGAGVAAAAAALALGVPLGSVLIVAAALACPLAMYFGMRGVGMGQTWPTHPLPIWGVKPPRELLANSANATAKRD